MTSTRPLRSALAALVTTAGLLGAFTGVADAQQAVGASIDSECNPTTGMFVVTVQLTNFLDEAGDPSGGFEYLVEGGGAGDGTMVFDPDPLPAEGTTVATFSVPGNTTQVVLGWAVAFSQFTTGDNTDFALGGNCELIPTTTTTTTTLVSTTTTTAAPAQVTQPRFTG